MNLDEMTFEQWMMAVDNILAEELDGLSSDDLPDQIYREWFDSEMTPTEAAAEVISNVDEEL